MRTSFLLSLIAIAALAGCNSSTSTSGSTQTPQTLTATVNGKPWSSTFNGTFSNAFIARLPPNGGAISATAADSSVMSIGIIDFTVPTDSLYYNNYAQFALVGDATPYLTNAATDTTYVGWVHITDYDTKNGLVSGTFQFVARKKNKLSDIVTVTNGSFYQLKFID